MICGTACFCVTGHNICIYAFHLHREARTDDNIYHTHMLFLGRSAACGTNGGSPFPFAVDKLLDGVAEHVLQRPVERQPRLLVHVEGQQAGQQQQQHWHGGVNKSVY